MQKPSSQISMFDTEETTEINSCNNCSSAFDDISADEILEKYSVELMELWITKRPCKSMTVS